MNLSRLRTGILFSYHKEHSVKRQMKLYLVFQINGHVKPHMLLIG